MQRAEFAEPSPQQLADGVLPENVRILAQTMIDFRLDDAWTWTDQRQQREDNSGASKSHAIERLHVPAFPKPRPAKLDRTARAATRKTIDDKESAKARRRANGRCEIVVIGEGRCERRDVHTHHLLGGWKRRGRGPSALAMNKLRVCTTCHADIHAHVLVRDGRGFRRVE